MALLPNPYQELPYNTLTRLGWSHLDKCVTIPVNKLIGDTVQLINAEAVADGQPELTNEQFLYERFKDNCSNNMWYGNWQVLKYFSRILQIKLYKAMLGVWSFTSNDVEMYDYFSTVNVYSTTKCKSTTIKCRTMADPDYEKILTRLCGVKHRILLTFSLNGSERPLSPIYYTIFEPFFHSIIDMVRNCKGLVKIHKPVKFFTGNYVEDYAIYYANGLCRADGKRKYDDGEAIITNVRLDFSRT